jgi:hypothetical protein
MQNKQGLISGVFLWRSQECQNYMKNLSFPSARNEKSFFTEESQEKNDIQHIFYVFL